MEVLNVDLIEQEDLGIAEERPSDRNTFWWLIRPGQIR